MRIDNIFTWLDTLPSQTSSSPLVSSQHRTKRIKLDQGQDQDQAVSVSRLPTPPLHDTDMLQSPNKRPRPSDEDDESQFWDQDLDETPRAPSFRQRLRQYQDAFPSSSPSRTSSVSRSSISNASSPTKQQRNAALLSTGYKHYTFVQNPDWQPEPLKRLKKKLEQINNGEKLIPMELKDQVADCSVGDAVFFDTAETTTSKTAWRYPDAYFVDEILDRAAVCLSENEGESSWNMEIHAPILKWVFPFRQSNLCQVRYCPSATIVPEFKPKNAPSQMVDFCIIARPQEETPEADAIEEICAFRPDKTINHTDWGNLAKDPIAISIETKKHGENWTKAIHQMGIWHAAQWRSLCFNIGGNDVSLSKITFLPGIIVQGHKWMFVATIYRLGRAKLFSEVAIGDTESKLGIFKLLVSLQCLRKWIEDEFWPAYKEDILGIPGLEGGDV
ncbi:hypothetical protein Forpe1208_v015620 [Fusarium oxysporum f. sp. rapae]|uniref:PD-(D/E)XK nuclease-like domain-containing protein n=1 Tax=Fusarium oxysporum f. sp. rapae TaxID=485398 RepID=A0A8J5NH64_FUSOX|nr:hypothetical protein Forpe1208_v015620 [Fusarium oxysporum f. sp. rapae]